LGPRELPAVVRPVFEIQGAVFVDCFEILKIHPYRRIGGWESKPYAIAHSPFEEVLFLDADNFALQNPEFLFSEKAYRETGAVFWPDFHPQAGDFWAIKPGAWKLLNLEPEEGAEIESGQLVINKGISWRALRVALHMNENSDFFYQHCTHGDKDTFLLSWRLTGAKTFVVSKRPELRTSPVRIQFAPDGTPLFQHSRKWLLPPHTNSVMNDFEMEREALGWLAEFQAAIPESAQWFAAIRQSR
jgi:hypothetical protein